MRLSDIIKKSSQGKQAARPVPPKEVSVPATPPPAVPKPVPASETSTPTTIEHTPPPEKPSVFAPKKEKRDVSQTEGKTVRCRQPVTESGLSASEVYSKAILEAKEIVVQIDKGETTLSSISSVPHITELVHAGNNEIITLADRATPDIYLYGHLVNVSIFSILLANALNLDEERTLTLGYCAFLHDIGLAKNLRIVLKNGKLTPAEYKRVREGIPDAHDFVQTIPDLTQELAGIIGDVMQGVYEARRDNFGNEELTDEDRYLFARIIAIADVYEALTHPRSYRDRYLPHDALKQMINGIENSFDQKILKAFIQEMSLYPLGSYVRLNTDEIARVVGVNRTLPTRPTIMVLVDPRGFRPKECRTVNLSSSPMLYVKEAVDETKLKINDKKLLLELKAIRWWVKGL